MTGQCSRGCAAGWTGTLCDKGLSVCFTIQNQITNHFYSKLDDDYLSKIALSFRDRHSQFQFYEKLCCQGKQCLFKVQDMFHLI